MDNTIFASVDQYIANLFNAPDEALEKTAASIESSGMPAISISPNQGKFLYLLTKLCRAKKILEIGTLGGYSTIWMAKALPKSGQLVTLEVDQHHADVAHKNIVHAGLADIVDIRTGNALELLPQIEAAGMGPFDMIFIDADKPPYAAYFEWALKLSGAGTLIIADNVIRQGKVLDPDSTDEAINGIQRFNQLLAASSSVSATILQMVGAKDYDGMALAIVQ